MTLVLSKGGGRMGDFGARSPHQAHHSLGDPGSDQRRAHPIEPDPERPAERKEVDSDHGGDQATAMSRGTTRQDGDASLP